MTEQSSKQCPICKLDYQAFLKVEDYGEQWTVKCRRCGTFKISRTAAQTANRKKLEPKLSAWIREHSEFISDVPEITTLTIDKLENELPDYSPREKQLKLLKYLEKKSSYPGKMVTFLPNYDYPVAWAYSEVEIQFYIRSLMDRGLVNLIVDETIEEEGVIITSKGWDYLDEHSKIGVFSDQIFVAMSFSEAMKPIYEKGIKPGIEKAGYKPYRIDIEPHIEKIDAKIITEIHNSRFLVADVTEQKPGVYFEAGYALGLGMPVIWSVRKDELEKVHFDTRQYNHIVWETSEKLCDDLLYRISATVGKGNKT